MASNLETGNFCRNYFGRSGYCSKGEECHFSHNEKDFLEAKNLAECVTRGCLNYRLKDSKSGLCGSCREKKNRKLAEKEMKKCHNDDCERLTIYKYCKQCYDEMNF